MNNRSTACKSLFELSAGVHSDQHARWIDPKNDNHLMIGSDGGLYQSLDQGRTWDFVNAMTTSEAYVVTADMRRPYGVYIGLQDNGSWGRGRVDPRRRHLQPRLVYPAAAWRRLLHRGRPRPTLGPVHRVANGTTRAAITRMVGMTSIGPRALLRPAVERAVVEAVEVQVAVAVLRAVGECVERPAW